MRCLYCGNELPVFKKLTGGGEFCSEAHRQSYQEEYNRLALSRLLQAQAPDDHSKTSRRGTTDTLLPHATESDAAGHQTKRTNGSGASKATLPTNGKHSTPPVFEAPIAAAATKTAVEEMEAPAKEADFLWEVPDPIWWDSADFRPADAAFCEASQGEYRPTGLDLLQLDEIEDDNSDLAMAEPFSLAALRQASTPRDYKTRARETRLEVREFGRVEPRVTVELGTAETTKLTTAVVARDYEIAATPPGDLGGWHAWTTNVYPFPEGTYDLEFADSVRLDFQTTGLEVPSEDGGETQIVQVPAPAVLSRLSEASKTSGVNQKTDLRSFLAAAEPVVVDPDPTEEHAFVAVHEPEPETELEILTETQAAPANEHAQIEARAEVIEEPTAVLAEEELVELEATAAELQTVAEPAKSEIEQIEEVAPLEEPAAAIESAEPEVAADPRRATNPMPIQPQAVAPAPASAQATVSWVPVTSFRMHLPRVAGLPMRPAMIFGPAPAGLAAKTESPIVEVPVKEAVVPQEKAPESPKTQATASQASADRRSRDSRNAARNLKIRNRGSQPPPTAPERPVAPAAVAPQPEPVRAAEAQVAPAAKEAPTVPREASKPVVAKAVEVPEPKPEPRVAEKPATDASNRSFGDSPHLDIQPVGFIEGLPGVVKIGAIAAVLAIIAFIGYLSLSSRSVKSGKETMVEAAGPSMLIGEGGWSTDWTGEASGAKRSRQISIYRPSLNLADYRVELQGQIEAKSMGVVYRANNPQNYYVVKLEILKPGLNPQVALVRWAVTNGEDGPKAQIPLPMPVRIDTLYKLRLDVRGNTFTTYVLDQKVDQWSDDRIHSGGVGLINERGDRSTIKAVMVTPLVTKAK